jgi:hypothetical protein
MNKYEVSQELYVEHRNLASQTEAIYIEINKLATKKPTEKVTKLISMKINHIIHKTKNLVSNDEFLDAIDTIPVDGDFIRLDESLIILGELRSVLDRQWRSNEFALYRRENNKTYDEQILR